MKKTYETFFTETLINKLGSISDEMAEKLVKSSYSTNIKERRDCSTAIMDKNVLIIYQAEHIPIHLGSFFSIIKSIYEIYDKQEIGKNDFFICNDVYLGGGSHLPDIVIVVPIYHKNKLINWIGNIAHHADFVDRGHEHIFQEGIIIPPTRIIKNNIIQRDIIRLIINNCQLPKEREIDILSQISANKIGKRRFQELFKDNSYNKLIKGYSKILNISTKNIINKISKLKEGSYVRNKKKFSFFSKNLQILQRRPK